MSSDRWTAEDYANYEAGKGALKVVPSAKPSKHDYKAEFIQQLTLVGIQVEPEFIFAPPRKWRSDWRVQGTNILIEFEGGLFAKGKQGHSSVTGILRDIEKYNEAALAGFMVIRITPKHVVSGDALAWVSQAIQGVKLTVAEQK